jgi:16S rRNA processing protein RimM
LSEEKTAEWVAVARLMRPQGRKGELLAEPLTDVPGVLVAGTSLRLAAVAAKAPGAADGDVALEDVWTPTGRNAGRVVLKLRGCDDISAAEGLAGKQLMLRKDALPTLEENQFYVGDLVGCVLLDGESVVGEIVDVQFPTTPDGRRLEEAADLFEVQPSAGGETLLVPFLRAWLVRVDLKAQRVEMQLPVGLVDAGELAGEPDEKP